MASRRKNDDLWDYLLYGGLFILLSMFFYQLLKLWNNTGGSVSSLLGSVGQAVTNTLGQIESALTGAVTSPLSIISAIFNAIPNFLNLILAFIASFFGGAAGAIDEAALGDSPDTVIGSTSGGFVVGQGSSALGVLPQSGYTFSAPGGGQSDGGLSED